MASTYVSDKEDVVCTICGGTPCDWEEYGEELTKQISMMYFREKHGKIDIVLDEGGNRILKCTKQCTGFLLALNLDTWEEE